MSGAIDEVSHKPIRLYYGDASRPACGTNHNIKVDNNSFERVEQSKYLETTLTYQNSIHENIKRILKSENACYHSVHNLLSSSLLSRNI